MSPKELYRFVEGETVWNFTSADENEEYNGELYVSSAIGRNEVESKNELSRANIEISFSIDDAFARRYLKSVIDEVVTLTIFRKESDGTVSVVWKGRLSSLKPNIAEIVLVFESVFTSLRRPGLRIRYQRSCPHTLYGKGCTLIKEDFGVTGVVTNYEKNVVKMPIAATYPSGYFTAGIIEAPDGSLRFITNHYQDTLTLIRSLDNLAELFAAKGYGNSYGWAYGDLTARIYPGCDRLRETCNDKFNNMDNYGGFPFIPLKNPFGGSSIV